MGEISTLGGDSLFSEGGIASGVPFVHFNPLAGIRCFLTLYWLYSCL